MSSQSRNDDQSCNDGNEERKREDIKVEDEFYLEIKSECETKEIARPMSISAGESAENLHVETVESEKKLVPKLSISIPAENPKEDTTETKLEEPKFSAMESEQRSLPTSSLNEDLTQSPNAHHVRRVRTKSENEQLTDWIQNQQNEQIQASLNKDSSLRHSVDVFGRTLLHISAKYGNVTATDRILDIFDVDARDANGRTALMLAVENNHVKIVKMLSAVSDLDVVDNEGKTVLHVAFTKDGLEKEVVFCLLRELQKRYANRETIASKLIDSGCPIHLAVLSRDVTLIKTMLDRADNINATDSDKGTALHWAVILQEPEIVKLLLDEGVDAETLDDHGFSPLCRIYVGSEAPGNRKKLAILDLLLARKVLLTRPIRNIFTQVSMTLIYGCAEAISRLLRPGCLDFGAVNAATGLWPMHYLAMNGNRGVAEQLKLHAAEHDYHVNAIDNDGRLPLNLAVEKGNVEMVQFLLEQGSDANRTMTITGIRNGITPIYFCAMHDRVPFERECLEVLLQHKADPQATFIDDADGVCRTLFDICPWSVRLRPIVAHLVLLERQGELVTELIRKKIRSSDEIQRYYRRCQAILDKKLSGSITIFKLLAGSDKKVMNCLSDEELRLKLKKLNKKLRIHDSYWYYYNVLRKRVVKLLRLRELRDKAAGTVCKLFANSIDEKHIVIENVLDFLDASSLEQLTLM